MFILKDFILKGLKDAVGKMADFQIILNAAGWLEKGVLSENDLSEISILIEAKNNTVIAEDEQEAQAEEVQK